MRAGLVLLLMACADKTADGDTPVEECQPLGEDPDPTALGGERTDPAESCLEILEAGESRGSRAYWIRPAAGLAEQYWCDMDADGGGWTILYAATGADDELPLTRDGVPFGQPTDFCTPATIEHYNISNNAKIDASALASETLVRKDDGTWLKASAAPFNADLSILNKHASVAVDLTASDGTTASGFMGWANHQNGHGGDFHISAAQPDQHDRDGKRFLNTDCAGQYLYSWSESSAPDFDHGYDVGVGLGDFTSTAACDQAEGGQLSFVLAVR